MCVDAGAAHGDLDFIFKLTDHLLDQVWLGQKDSFPSLPMLQPIKSSMFSLRVILKCFQNWRTLSSLLLCSQQQNNRQHR